MAAINKVISYRGRTKPTGKGLAKYVAKDKENREKVMLLDGRGKPVTAKELGTTLEKPLDKASEVRKEYADWAKREGVSFRRDRTTDSFLMKGTDGKEYLVKEMETEEPTKVPSIEKLANYLSKEKSGRERQMLLDSTGNLLSPKDAVREVREKQANFWHAITAPSEIGCAALMERYRTTDTTVAAIEHGKLLSERIGKLTKGDRPAFAIHWDSATKWHYHWLGTGEPKATMAGANGVIQKAWDIEFEEKFDRSRVKNWKAFREYESTKKENIALNKEIREFDNEKFKILKSLSGDEKAAAKLKFDSREAEFIERRYLAEVKEADLQYKAFGSQGSSRHLSALEQAELTRRSSMKKLAKRDLSYYDRSKAAEAKNKERLVQGREKRATERSARGKELYLRRTEMGHQILESARAENRQAIVKPGPDKNLGPDKKKGPNQKKGPNKKKGLNKKPRTAKRKKMQVGRGFDPLAILKKAKREAVTTEDRVEEHQTMSKDQVQQEAQILDGVGIGFLTDLLADGAKPGKSKPNSGKGKEGEKGKEPENGKELEAQLEPGSKAIANAAERTATAAVVTTGSQESAVDARAGVEAVQSLKGIVKDLNENNLISAAQRAASGVARVAGTANRPLQELTEDFATVAKILMKPIKAVQSVTKGLDFER